MASDGYITFYTTRQSDPAALIRGTFACLTNAKMAYAWRTIGEDRSWDEATGELDDDAAPPIIANEAVTISYAPSRPMDRFGREEDDGPPDRLVRPGTSLTVVIASDDWRPLDAAMRVAIPDRIAGGFYPNSPSVQVGWHDLFGAVADKEQHYFDRPFYSFRLTGNGTPNDWVEFPRLALGVPAVRALKAKLEAFAGPLEECVYWEGL